MNKNKQLNSIKSSFSEGDSTEYRPMWTLLPSISQGYTKKLVSRPVINTPLKKGPDLECEKVTNPSGNLR